MASTTTLDLALGPYQLRERLAVGGMGEVFRAWDTLQNEWVAVKIVLPQHLSNRELVQSVEREARLQRLVRHPNLIQLRDVGRADGAPYLVMELVDGVPLSDLLDEPFDSSSAYFLIRQILAGLHALHTAVDRSGTALEIVHRDMKPGNVLVTREGVVKVGDLGIARSALESRTLTRTGFIRGSVAYLAPEQATQSEIDARTDVYLAGLVLFEMLTGERYLQGDREIDLLHAAESPTWRAPSTLGAERCWDPILKKALARFPEERYRSAAAMEKSVATIVPATEWNGLSLARRMTSRQPPRLQLAPPPRKRPLTRPLVASIVAVAAVGVSWATMGPTQELELRRPPNAERFDTSPTSSELLREYGAPTPPVTDAPSDPMPVQRKGNQVPQEMRRETPPKRKARSKTPAEVAQKLDSPTAEPVIPPVVEAQPEFDPRPVLTRAIGRLDARGLSVRDLPRGLAQQLADFQCETDRCASETDALRQRIDAVTLSRELVERKVARLQRALEGATPPNSKRKSEWKTLSGLALQSLFDGKLAEANSLLNRLERSL